jgi:hypothetical protein
MFLFTNALDVDLAPGCASQDTDVCIAKGHDTAAFLGRLVNCRRAASTSNPQIKPSRLAPACRAFKS